MKDTDTVYCVEVEVPGAPGVFSLVAMESSRKDANKELERIQPHFHGKKRVGVWVRQSNGSWERQST